jgi:hypothetical protein
MRMGDIALKKANVPLIYCAIFYAPTEEARGESELLPQSASMEACGGSCPPA